jgi:ATP-dependent helicase/nuclease subunit A
MTAIDTANAQQRAASDPAVSAFVAASAGSGKTKLLTDRLLRLMLTGTRPEAILCLTYTKAAAAEMRLRLNARLGAWVTMPDAALAGELRGLDVPPGAAPLARRLFAQVLDLPGGMRIETIHAFCQSLLRRFPVEARLSPHFEVEDEAQGAQRLREAREAALTDPTAREAVRALAAEMDEASFAALTAAFAAHAPPGLWEQDVAAAQRVVLGAEEESAGEILREAVAPPRETVLRDVLREILERGNKSGTEAAGALLDWLSLPHARRAAGWDVWAEGFLTAKGEARTFKGYCGPKLKTVEDGYKTELIAEAGRVAGVQERLRTARLAALNAHLMALLAPITSGERAGREQSARLSYGDLIAHTAGLLVDPGAAWVLYKLDGGIEHLLLDEVQDTAPAQWEIASALAAEFFAGEGAREAQRSIFAVGDAKQSIFSFQGADLRSFVEYRGKFRAQAKGAGRVWLDGELSVSFRSSAPVLALTDAVFGSGPARAGVLEADEVLAHGVSRAGQAGRVTLWPLTPAQEAEAPPEWDVPETYHHAQTARAALAERIADYVQARLGQPLPSRGRAARPGDFLILVRQRNTLVGAINTALKGRGIPVAGADRVELTAQIAVGDMLALCDALLLPEDDLAFAQYLASPLGGLSDESLMELALGRRGGLVAALFARAGERADWAAAKAFFEALRGKTDFYSPYALLAEALDVLGGRARLLRRLGPEAAEPLDELLAEALAYQHAEPASLQGFLARLRQAGAVIKRESGAGADEVRIMTVHGAKGLQAPIVILPDTTGVPKAGEKLFWLDGVPVYCPRTELRNAAVAAAAAAHKRAQEDEQNRLLYVALTRAEDELLVCGAEGKRAPTAGCWYESVTAGFARLETREADGALVHETAQTAVPDRRARAAAVLTTAPLPRWAGAAPDWVAVPPAKEDQKPERIVPSRAMEDGVKKTLATSPLAVPVARAAALEKGVAVHALLQHLPDLPVEAREDAARRHCAAEGLDEDVAAQVLGILGNPGLAALFGPGSRAEVPLAGVAGGAEIGGIIDRLAVTEAEVVIADYKTDRAPPAAVPEKYAAQLNAYRAVLAQIYPDKPVRCLIVWTQTGAVTALS